MRSLLPVADPLARRTVTGLQRDPWRHASANFSRPATLLRRRAGVALVGLHAALLGHVQAGSVAAEQELPPAPILTIYSSLQPGQGIPRDALAQARASGGYGAIRDQVPGFAFVRQHATLDLKHGRNSVRFSDVAALIEPTTVAFESLTAPTTTRVLEQNFQFDLVGRERLLERYLDKTIRLYVKSGDASMLVSGTLLSTAGGIVLRSDNGNVGVFNNVESLQLPALPDGLLTKPTLLWELETEQPGSHLSRITYETGGMTWWADYNALFTPGKDNNSGTLNLSAWVSIVNQSGASFENARLRLIAGRVNRVQPEGRPFASRAMRTAEMQADAGGFEQRAFFEYHLYTLGRDTTLPDNSTKQIELFAPVRSIPVEKVLVFDALGFEPPDFGQPMSDQGFGQQGKSTVDVYLRFKNTKESGLGIPLPAGRVRVSQIDADTRPRQGLADAPVAEFVGEDLMRHTPRDETVLLKIGAAFDVVGERTVQNFEVDHARRTMTETVEIKVRNRKDVRTDVIVHERLYRWTNWELQTQAKYTRQNATTVHFPLSLNPGEEGVVRYTVRYSW